MCMLLIAAIAVIGNLLERKRPPRWRPYSSASFFSM
jgi:hypothetical protein